MKLIDKIKMALDIAVEDKKWFSLVMDVEGCEVVSRGHIVRDGFVEAFYGLEDLIIRLRKPVPKYKSGDTVWFLAGSDGVISFEVHEVTHKNGDYWYGDFDQTNTVREDILFPSRESLIQAQINHWTGLLNTEKSTGSEDVSMESTSNNPKNPDPKPESSNPNGDCMGVCEHESDGFLFLSKPPKKRCKKCGGLYP